jgi:hypothetical protein
MENPVSELSQRRLNQAQLDNDRFLNIETLVLDLDNEFACVPTLSAAG